jgi:hypothetical protein
VAAGTVRADNPEGRKHTIAYLKKLQLPIGGFLPEEAQGERRPAMSLRATSAAIRALHYLEGEVPNKEAAARFVQSCYDAKSGGFANQPLGTPDVICTAVGLMAVEALKMPEEPFVKGGLRYLDDHAKTFEEIRLAAAAQEAVKKTSPRTEDWLKQVLATANFDGSYGADAGRARATGGAVAAVLRLGGMVADKVVVLTAINEGQRTSGGWGKADDEGADLESTYRVMRALYMLKVPPAELESVRSFVAKCRNEDGGYGLAPGEPSNVSGTYFAAILMHWMEAMEKWKK